MGMPLKTEYKPGKGLSQISASDLNTISRVINTIGVTIAAAGTKPEVNRTNASGEGWQIVIPQGGTSLPDGTTEDPHLVWDPTGGDDNLGAWVVGTIIPDGGGSFCVAIWSPDEDTWTALDMGSDPYKPLQLDSGGNPIMDYVRWV